MKFRENFRGLYRRPDTFALLTLLFLGLVFVIVGAIAAPGPVTLPAILVFVGIGVALIKGFSDLAEFRTMARLKDSELRAVIQYLNDAVVIYDPDFRITEWNRAAEALFNLRKEEISGLKVSPDSMRLPRFKILTMVFFPTLAPTVTQISSGPPQVVEITVDEPALRLRSATTQILDENGKLKGFLKIVEDLSREKQIAESKSEFLTVAAHQLRTPLTAIKWAFETIAGAGTPEIKENAQKGVELSDRMIKIVNDLLDAAKIEEGRFGFKFQETDLSRFLKSIADEAGIVAESYNIKLNFVAPNKNYKVKIDPERLGIALTNLLDNAIRYNSPGGSVTIDLEEMKGGRFVKVNVRDTGIGIPENEIKRVFTKFHRGQNIADVAPNGSGLGLYITKNIVQGHGGEISVESEVGRGTKFSFTLPLDFSLVPERKIIEE